MTIGSGNTVSHGGTTEGQISNNGTVTSTLRSFYTSNTNGASATFATNAILYGYDDIWTNSNTTAGSIWQHVGYHCNAMAGAGSTPTFNFCLRNDDTLGLISTLGVVSIGSNAAPGAGVQLKILGPDSSSTSLPLQISTAALPNILLARDSGEVDMNGALLALGVAGTRSSVLQVQSATAGNSAQVQGGTSTGAFYQILGTQITGTPANYACWQSNGIMIFNANPCDSGNTAPTIASGFGTSPAIANASGPNWFQITVGTSPSSSGVLTLPAKTNGWQCFVTSHANSATEAPVAVFTSTTSVTVTNYVRTTGIAGNFTASETLDATCTGAE
jgi:hypothetical protein